MHHQWHLLQRSYKGTLVFKSQYPVFQLQLLRKCGDGGGVSAGEDRLQTILVGKTGYQTP